MSGKITKNAGKSDNYGWNWSCVLENNEHWACNVGGGFYREGEVVEWVKWWSGWVMRREGWWCLRILILHSHMCILHPSFFFFWKYQVTLFPTLVLPLCVNYSRDDTSFSRDNNNFTFFMTTFRPPPHESWCHKTSSPSSFFCMSWLKVRIQSKTWCFVFQNVFFLIFIFNHYSGDTIPKAI